MELFKTTNILVVYMTYSTTFETKNILRESTFNICQILRVKFSGIWGLKSWGRKSGSALMDVLLKLPSNIAFLLETFLIFAAYYVFSHF